MERADIISIAYLVKDLDNHGMTHLASELKAELIKVAQATPSAEQQEAPVPDANLVKIDTEIKRWTREQQAALAKISQMVPENGLNLMAQSKDKTADLLKRTADGTVLWKKFMKSRRFFIVPAQYYVQQRQAQGDQRPVNVITKEFAYSAYAAQLYAQFSQLAQRTKAAPGMGNGKTGFTPSQQ